MRIGLLALSLFLMAAACSSPAPTPPPSRQAAAVRDSAVLWPESGVVLGREDAVAVLHQCSRRTPAATAAGFWSASPAQVAALEAGLTPLLRTKLAGDREWQTFRREHLSYYHRQYAGLTVAGRRIIYVSGSLLLDTIGWRRPAIVCDGGINYFGVEYDPATGDFRNFVFNGTA
jgi:hypothetical protein